MQANRLHRSNVGLAELKGASAEPLCGLKRLTDRLIDHLEYEGERGIERERGLPTALSICLLLFLGSCWQLATGDKLTSPRKWPSKQSAASSRSFASSTTCRDRFCAKISVASCCCCDSLWPSGRLVAIIFMLSLRPRRRLVRPDPKGYLLSCRDNA